MLRSIMMLSLLASSALSAEEPRPTPFRRGSDASATHLRRPNILNYGPLRTPGIRIWTSGDDLVRRGERVRVFYRTERDAYVTIFRIDTDGRVRLLFPRDPDDENYGYGGATYSVSSEGRGVAFHVDDYAGVGYIFGIASTAPFDYEQIWGQGRWDLHAISDGRIHGDPLTSMEELSARLLPHEFLDYDTHLLPYYVERRYSYPRFVCYDCHTYIPFMHWDPYLAWCRRYTLVVWNDPYYYYPSYWYPSRYYGGTRVVYTSPGGRRYVFKDRDHNSPSSPGIDYRDRRTTPTTVVSGSGRRLADDLGVRGSDLGGVGSVPAPRTPNRRVAPELDRRGEEPRRGESTRREVAGQDRQGDEPARGAILDGRRRPDGATGTRPPAPNVTPTDAGARRRIEESPGIQIVPRNDGEARPADPARGRRQEGTEWTPEPQARTPEPQARPDKPASDPQRREAGGAEPRPQRPDATPTARPQPSFEVTRPESRQPESRQPASRQPEARQPEARQPEARQPEARRPEARQPESRPQAPPRQPEARQPEARQPESRGNPDLIRRRP